MPTRASHVGTAGWICVLAVWVLIAGVADVALIDAFTANETATANTDDAGTTVTCDTSTGRMLYVAALRECLPAQW
jgi:hypothetical protein